MTVMEIIESNMTGWIPLFQQIIGSSVWGEPDHVRIAWITLMATSNKNGVSSVTVSGLARLANITLDQARNAVEVLSSPDPDSNSQEHEGRRIKRVDNGYLLLNFQRYREMAKKQIVAEANREAQERYREKKQKEESECDGSTSWSGRKLK